MKPGDLVKGLTLTHVKIFFEGGDELILSGNEHYSNFDLNLAVRRNGKVKEAWFDG